MSLRTTCTRLGTSVLGSCRTLVLAGAVVLLVGVSCTSATIDSTPQAAGGGGGGAGQGEIGGGSGEYIPWAGCIQHAFPNCHHMGWFMPGA